MSTLVKNCLGVALIIAVLLAGGAALSYVYSYARSIPPSAYRSFVASGEGKVTIVPDIAQFSASVITQGGVDLKSLQQQNSQQMNDVTAFLKSENIDAKDIQTQGYDISPRYQYYSCSQNKPCPPPDIVGYSVTQTASIKVRDFSKIGDILSGVVTHGANSVSQLTFTVDDMDSVRSEARAQAIEKAQAQAVAVAQAAGFKLGKLLSVDETGPSIPTPMYAYGMGGGPASSVAPSISPGSQEITVDLNLRYEIR